MSIIQAFYFRFLILAFGFVGIVFPLFAQDLSTNKSNELGFTFGNVLNKNYNIGIGPKFTLMYHNWNASNRALRIGISYGGNNDRSTRLLFVDDRNSIKEEFDYYKNKDIVTFSLGQLFQKKVYPRLDIFLAYDIHLGLVYNTVAEYYQKRYGNLQNYIYAKTKDEKYLGGLVQVMPAAGIKWRVFKKIIFTTELAILPMIFEVDKTIEIGFNPHLQAHVGLSYKF